VKARRYDPPAVCCGKCGAEMEIAAWWINGLPKPFYGLPVEEWAGPVPCPNRSHQCGACGHLWLSSDGLEVVSGPGGGRALRWFVWPV